MSKWISTYFKLLPNIRIPPIAASLLGRIQVDKAYSRAANVLTFLKRLVNITMMSEQWDLIFIHLDVRKAVDVFALSIYGLVIIPKVLGHVDDAVSNIFNQLDKRVIPVPTILTETFRSLSVYRRVGERRFIGCAQLLLAWFYNQFWMVEKVSYRVFSEVYSLLKEFEAIPRRENSLAEKWMAIL
ncbi:hypothetical protein Golax_003208 [Gossypium laxum]|uniref:DUF7745 domain-containing protein n=2 Tax=Gossypium laxum TaxID=34288 RepID=A0A7J9AEP9_9ROSI|nr:hypothetical protein [Gossypium laxum]